MSVIDAHVHLWDLAARAQPWTSQFPVLQRGFLLPELALGTLDAAGRADVLGGTAARWYRLGA